jgi:hypothetical protein
MANLQHQVLSSGVKGEEAAVLLAMCFPNDHIRVYDEFGT